MSRSGENSVASRPSGYRENHREWGWWVTSSRPASNAALNTVVDNWDSPPPAASVANPSTTTPELLYPLATLIGLRASSREKFSPGMMSVLLIREVPKIGR